MFIWSGGSDITESIVCSAGGESIARRVGPIIELAPSRRFAAVVSGKGTPQVSKGQILVYDLVSGERRQFDAEFDETAYVEAIEWRDDDVVFSIGVGEVGESDKFIVPLRGR